MPPITIEQRQPNWHTTNSNNCLLAVWLKFATITSRNVLGTPQLQSTHGNGLQPAADLLGFPSIPEMINYVIQQSVHERNMHLNENMERHYSMIGDQ